jgi:hypothetical protein
MMDLYDCLSHLKIMAANPQLWHLRSEDADAIRMAVASLEKAKAAGCFDEELGLTPVSLPELEIE